MKKTVLSFVILTVLVFTSCIDDDSSIVAETTYAKEISDINLDGVVAPATYTFERLGNTSVDYSGQTTRIKMLKELTTALKVSTNTEVALDGMFNHSANDVDFSDANLNASSKNIRSKTAASSDFFAGEVEGLTIKEYFDDIISSQVSEVFPNWATVAAPGTAGQISDGGSTRYVSSKGVEYNQLFAKGIIGALQLDQALNNYMSKLSTDDNTTVSNNSTTMEYHLDEAYGYLLNPEDSSFFSNYLAKVNENPNFSDIQYQVEEAFKIARQAIVDQKYNVRDQAIEVLRYQVSKVVAIRAVHYLQSGKSQLNPGTMGGAFHDLSEGLGFVYSLRFVRKSDLTETYFTKTEVDGFLAELDANNGFWDVTPTTLDAISDDIANKFDFTVAQAAL